MIKPETVLLSGILLPAGRLYLDDDLFSESNGVTLSKALYTALGEVSRDAKRRYVFCGKVQEVMALRYGLHDVSYVLLKKSVQALA
jgi:hypothetical protein